MNFLKNLRLWWLVFSFVLGLTSGLSTVGWATETIEKPPLVLGQNEQRILNLGPILRFSFGGDAARAQSLPAQLAPKNQSKKAPSSESNREKGILLIKGIHPGTSDLWVWNTDGTADHRSIRVQKLNPDEFKPQLQRALSQLQEVEIIYSGSGVILQGEVKTLAESARLQGIIEGFPQEVHNLTETAANLLEQGRKSLESWLKSSHYESKLRIEARNNTLILRGNLEQAYEQASVRKKALHLFPLVQIEYSSLPDDSPTIYFQVFLLELKKNRFHNLGLSWPGNKESAFRVSSGGIESLLQLDLTLQELEGDGSAKILSNPELAVRAPGEAELFSGGEIPIHNQSHFSSSITWKNFGLTLRLKVNQVAGEKIRLDIFTEVSHLDTSLGEDKTPGIQANRMKTQVDARFGVPLLLSGLLQQNTRQQAKGLPFLRDIPVLGPLFGSEDYLKERSELVAILLPRVDPPTAPMSEVQKASGNHRLIPKGPNPPPREWISPQEEQTLIQDPRFPWNILDAHQEKSQ